MPGYHVDPLRLAGRPGVKHRRYPGELAAWVADMDFEPCPAVVDAIQQQLATGDLGYPDWKHYTGGSPAAAAFVERCARRYSWIIDEHDTREWCDVVQAVHTLLHVCTEPGDGVVLHTPSYPPLWKALEAMDRRLVGVPAMAHGDGWVFDYDELERRLGTEQRVRAILLCHPHNPTGHVFDAAELSRLAEIAARFDLLIISDEIHADLTYAPAQHTPMGAIAPDRTVSIHSASKSFSLAGLRYAVSHVGPQWVRDRISHLPDHLLGAVNLFGAVAAEAAWRHGDDWLAGVMGVLDGNRRALVDLLVQQLPGIRYRPPAATYLAWLDCAALGLGDDPSVEFHRRGVALSPGPDFGRGGEGFVRLNLATSPQRLGQIVGAMSGRSGAS
jgi:cystathionine beta-lyase